MRLLYGQIRHTNYDAIHAHYGHEPPWPMDRSPHMSLVEAVAHGRDAHETEYFEYLRRAHGDGAKAKLAQQASWVMELLDGAPLRIQVEHEAVLDGNHRTAVAIYTDRTPILTASAPYQTLELPDGSQIPGRRMPGREIPVDLKGKRVLDLGCAQGMMSLRALSQGARSVLSVDADLRSTTWQMRDAWGFTERMDIRAMRIEDFDPSDTAADVVLAYSIVQHVNPSAFSRITHGRVCVLETHSEGALPPSTGHNWKFVEKTVYSRAEPERRRDLYVGIPT